MTQRTIAPRTAWRAYRNALLDLSILSGEEIGPSDVSWQDVAGTCAVNLRCVAAYLDQLREGGRGSVHDLFALPCLDDDEPLIAAQQD